MIAPPPAPPKRQSRRGSGERPWSVTMLGFLLFLQGMFLLALGLTSGIPLYLLLTGGVEEVTRWTGLGLEAQRQALPDWIAGLILLPLALLSVVAMLGFLRLWRGGWVYAMFVQGLILLASLIFYVRGTADYATMAFGVFIVLYLNYAEVRASFRPPLAESEEQL
jgi:hypothetical protein